MEMILPGFSASFESQRGWTEFEILDWFTAADTMIGSMFIWKTHVE